MSRGSFQGVSYYHGTVPIPGSSLGVYVYTVEGMLVDSGPSRFRKEVNALCTEQKVDRIVHTHFHEDHTGNSAYLSKKHEIPVYIHGESIELCRKRAKLPWYRHLYWGERIGFDPLPLPQKFNTGRREWEVLTTPGHSNDHIVLLDKSEGILFTGDLFVHPKIKVAMRVENLPRLMNSFRKILEQDFQTVFCFHAGIVKDGYGVLRAKLNLLEDLQGQALLLYRKGKSIKEIDKEMFPGTSLLTYVSKGEWSSYNLVRSLIEDIG